MPLSEMNWDPTFGRRLSAVERSDRIDAVRHRAGLILPEELLGDIWPRPFDTDGTPKPCAFSTVTDGRLPVGRIHFEDRERMVVELAIEAACGIPIERPWHAVPHHCENRECCEPHHWTVHTGNTALPLASAGKGPRAGFQRIFYPSVVDPLVELIYKMDDWEDTETAMLQHRLSYYPLALVRHAHEIVLGSY